MDAYDGDRNARHGPDEPTGAERPDGLDGPHSPDTPDGLEGPDGPERPDGPNGPDRPGGPNGPDRPGGPDEPTVGPGAGAEPQDVPLAAVPLGAAPPAVASTAPYPEPRTGVAALSLRYQICAAVALAVVATTVCVHIGMVFLHVAPPNTVTKQHGKAIDDWIYPEFEQNWKLFAPNPLQQNIAVQVRAEIATADGDVRTTGWYDLSAQDGRDIDGNLLPSHTQQNELRRAWDFFVATHDAQNRPVGLRGALAETYLRHIVVLRLDREGAAGEGGVVERVQMRSRTTNVRPPEWSGERVSDRPTDRVLPWWSVPGDEAGQAAEVRGGER
jgi:hypothetical protein